MTGQPDLPRNLTHLAFRYHSEVAKEEKAAMDVVMLSGQLSDARHALHEAQAESRRIFEQMQAFQGVPVGPQLAAQVA